MDVLRIITKILFPDHLTDLRKLGEEQLRATLRKEMTDRLERAIPSVVRTLKKQTDPEKLTPRGRIREALFLLWKSLVRKGELADIFRDSQDDRIIAALGETQLTEGVDPTEALVRRVAQEMVRLTL